MKPLLAVALAGLAQATLAQAPADCPDPAEVAQRHLVGRWQAEIDGTPLPLVLVLVKHPEYAETVRGTLQRGGAHVQLAGDVEEGELTLEESANGVNISATWLGDVVEGSCGREIRGKWRADGGTPRAFVMRKQ